LPRDKAKGAAVCRLVARFPMVPAYRFLGILTDTPLVYIR
jgi:hypothetical protein